MRILIDINHPAHVHLFKNFAWIMEEKGHTLLFTTRKKDVAIDLLTKYKFNFISFGNHYKSLSGKLWGFIKFDWKMLLTSIKFKPDIFLTMGGMYASHIAKLLSKPHIALDDTEHAKEHHIMYVPFTEVCLNPSCFHKDFGEKQIFYDGYHELAYLHPNYFTPDSGIFRELGMKKNTRYVVIRFVSWNASHDIGQKGMTLTFKRKLVYEISKYAEVIISSEEELPEEFKKYQFKIHPDKMHNVLAFASLFIGESSTMASESACLGTPAIYVNSLEVGYCTEQEEYGLLSNFRSPEGVLEKSLQLITTKNLKQKYRKAHEKMLSEKIDVTEFLVWFIEDYPQSAEQIKNDPGLQQKFM